MISSRNTLATIFTAIALVIPFPAFAAVVENVWEEIDLVILNDQNCGDATVFHLEGMTHRKISTLRNGQLAINVNLMGSLTPLDGANEGEPAIFRQNVHNVLPVDQGDNFVWTVGEVIRVIGTGDAVKFRLNANFHVIVANGEVKSYLETEKVSCW